MAERTRITREIVQRLADGAPPDPSNGDYAEQMQALAESWLVQDRDLWQTRCNAGHETRPLRLWDCPECTRAGHVAELRAIGSELHAAGVTKLPQWPSGVIMRRIRALDAKCGESGE